MRWPADSPHEAWVEVSTDGAQSWTRAPELGTSPTATSVTCYIEATSGALFKLCHRDTRPVPERELLKIDYFVDGTMARSHNVFPKQKGNSSCEGLRDGSTSILPFQFDAIKTGEEGDDLVGPEALPAELGEIRIEIWRAKSRTLNQPNGRGKAWSRPVERTYHEKVAARKRSHNVGFGAARSFSVSGKSRKDGRPMTVCDRIGSWPVMQYRFLYRSRSILEVAGITVGDDGDEGFELVESESEDDMSSFSDDSSNDLFARASTASSEAKPRFRASLGPKRESSNLPIVARSAKYASGGKEVSEAIIISDDENDEGKAASQLKSVRSELAFLRAENERLRKRVKKEEVSDTLIDLE